MNEPTETELVVAEDRGVRWIYDETLHLRELGRLTITRASHVGPDAEGFWWADMGPAGGPVLGLFGTRGEALRAESGCLGRMRGVNGHDQWLATLDFPSGPFFSQVRCIASFVTSML